MLLLCYHVMFLVYIQWRKKILYSRGAEAIGELTGYGPPDVVTKHKPGDCMVHA